MGGLTGGTSDEKEAIRWAKSLSKGIKRDVLKAMHVAEKTMPAHAKSHHKFNSKSGRTDRGIKASVELRGGVATFTFWGEPVIVSSGYNNLWMQNDGTRGNYKRGSISPSARTVGGKRGTGIRHDDFMGNAWNINSRIMINKIDRIFDRMK